MHLPVTILVHYNVSILIAWVTSWLLDLACGYPWCRFYPIDEKSHLIPSTSPCELLFACWDCTALLFPSTPSEWPLPCWGWCGLFYCVFVWCAHLREHCTLTFFLLLFFPSSRSCFVNPMKRNVLSTGKPQQCPSVLTNSKHRVFLPAGNCVWCVPICGPGVMLLLLAPLFTNIFSPFCIHPLLPPSFTGT